MKITVRIPTEQYAFQEIEFDSIEQYMELMPKFVGAYIATKKELKKVIELNQEPF